MLIEGFQGIQKEHSYVIGFCVWRAMEAFGGNGIHMVLRGLFSFQTFQVKTKCGF